MPLRLVINSENKKPTQNETVTNLMRFSSEKNSKKYDSYLNINNYGNDGNFTDRD
jgi:hypothetical protein